MPWVEEPESGLNRVRRAPTVARALPGTFVEREGFQTQPSLESKKNVKGYDASDYIVDTKIVMGKKLSNDSRLGSLDKFASVLPSRFCRPQKAL